jgi:Na+:H+ antiporter, NhaA family
MTTKLMTDSKLKNALHHEAAPGVLLMIAMVSALIVANSGVEWYGALLDTVARVGIGSWEIKKPLLLWINDGLMAVFFLLVGLELKREVIFGELSDRRKVILPLFAAIGGIVIPSGIYAYINWGDPVGINGWAIPAATDIAFALGILALLGSRAPVALKILLTSIAVIDDLAAIVIIAVFYTDQLSMLSLGVALVTLIGLFFVNKSGVRKPAPYVLLGIVLWVAVLKSGVHATLAGVALAAFIPVGMDAKDKTGLAYKMEHGLHSWVAFMILPIFAFANAGVPILGMEPSTLLSPVPLGIAAGLFFGKQIGIFTASMIVVKTGLARLPGGVGWLQLYGLSCLCGIGFTMSLFIGSLAFEGAGGPDYAVDDRIGILAGSFLSAIVGVLVLLKAKSPKGSAVSEAESLDGGLLGPAGKG